MWHYTGPAAISDMRIDAQERVAHYGGVGNDAYRGEYIVDYAPILHVFTKKAQLLRGCFRPSDSGAMSKRTIAMRYEDVMLYIEWHPAHILKRLVFEIGYATIQFKIVQCTLDSARA
jgi:hypothetical protein